MASDDETSELPEEKPEESGDVGEEARADEALARARAAVEKAAPAKKSDPGRWLALVPITIGVLMFALTMPRATVPDAVPLPTVDARALETIMRADDERAARAKATRLPSDVLALGSAVRALQAVQQKDDPTDNEQQGANAMLDDARRILAGRKDWQEDVLVLRAVQMSAFLEELARYEGTGTVSKDLEELGGGFVRRMNSSGWAEGRRIVLDGPQRRAIFKTVWNAIAGVDMAPAFALALDEQRALYTLYLSRPYAGEQQLRTIEAQRRDATTSEQCMKAAANERRAREDWRADKIRRLGQIDPAYPTAYALGVVYYRGGHYDLSSDAFRAWIDAHPDGPLAARARNHLKAALSAYGSI